MLTETEKRIINGVLENWSELQSITLSISERTAEIYLFVTMEKDDWAAANTQTGFCTLQLSGLSKIAISSHSEKLPPEIQATKAPSAEIILFLASLFQQQNVYEWNCFEDPMRRFKGAWSPNWIYKFESELGNKSDCILFYKERNPSLWVIGLWFSKLELSANLGGNLIGSVEEFAAKFPKRLGENPPSPQ